MMTAGTSDFELEAVRFPVDYGKISSLCETFNDIFFLNKESAQRGVNINFSTFPKWAIGQFIRRNHG